MISYKNYQKTRVGITVYYLTTKLFPTCYSRNSQLQSEQQSADLREARQPENMEEVSKL